MSNVELTALRAHKLGLCVYPPAEDGSKRPAGPWAQYQKKRPSTEQVLAWYGGSKGVGLICGAVSGGLEVLDFDDRGVWSEYQRAAFDAGLGDILKRITDGYFEFSPNGAHLLYRCETIEGNLKLAQRDDNKTMIETRGEGGYIIIAPTGREVNRAGEYVLVYGALESIATISAEERAELHRLARSFGQHKIERADPTPRIDSDRPGDILIRRMTWPEVLEPHGWRRVYERGGVVYWRRPGKAVGVSATTNYGGSDLLYVFSSSTELEPGRGYNRFSAWAALNHGGDFKAAAREAAVLYEPQLPEIDISGVLAERLAQRHPFPPEYFQVPGAVGAIQAWIHRTAGMKQPILALASALAVVGTVTGRKVQTASGLRTNIYALGVARSGYGKEHPRQCAAQLLRLAGMRSIEEISSDTALLQAMVSTPAMLLLWDEIGISLRMMLDEKRAASYHTNLMRALLRLYSSASGGYSKDFADSDLRIEIDQPHLCMFATTTPHSLYAALSSEQVASGLLSRLLVFPADGPRPLWTEPEIEQPPASVTSWLEAWARASAGSGDLASLHPTPPTAMTTTQARGVFASLREAIARRQDELEASHRDGGIYARVAENAERLALIRAAGDAMPGEVEIRESDAEWGCSVSWTLTDMFCASVAEKVVDTDTQRMISRVVDICRRSGGSVTRRDLCRSIGIQKRDLTALLDTMSESGLVSLAQRGRSVVVSLAPQPH